MFLYLHREDPKKSVVPLLLHHSFVALRDDVGLNLFSRIDRLELSGLFYVTEDDGTDGTSFDPNVGTVIVSEYPTLDVPPMELLTFLASSPLGKMLESLDFGLRSDHDAGGFNTLLPRFSNLRHITISPLPPIVG